MMDVHGHEDEHEEGEEHDEDEHHEDEDEHGHDEDEHDEDEDEHGHEEDEHDEDEDEHGHEEDEHGHAHGEFDPHVWMDPTLVAVWAEEIAEALAGVDPEHGADYAERAKALAGELHALDAWVQERVAAVPRDRRILVTDHDVFGYFADRYGFTVARHAHSGILNVGRAVRAGHLASLREAMAEHEVPAIFVGLTVSTHVAQVVADDLGIEVVSVYTGSLSEPDGRRRRTRTSSAPTSSASSPHLQGADGLGRHGR